MQRFSENKRTLEFLKSASDFLTDITFCKSPEHVMIREQILDFIRDEEYKRYEGEEFEERERAFAFLKEASDFLLAITFRTNFEHVMIRKQILNFIENEGKYWNQRRQRRNVDLSLETLNLRESAEVKEYQEERDRTLAFLKEASDFLIDIQFCISPGHIMIRRQIMNLIGNEGDYWKYQRQSGNPGDENNDDRPKATEEEELKDYPPPQE